MSTFEIRDGSAYEQQVLSLLLALKSVEHTISSEPNNQTIKLIAKDFLVEGLVPCVLYADAKHPVPQFIPHIPEHQALILMIINNFLSTHLDDTHTKHQIDELTQTADPYILGDNLSLLDLLVAPFTRLIANQHYGQALARAITKWNRSLSPALS
jgi:hypothetical protein